MGGKSRSGFRRSAAVAICLALGTGALEAGQVEIVSANPGSTSGNGPSAGPAISADGRFVAFTSLATDLVAGMTDANGPGNGDVFLRDRLTGVTVLASRSAASATTTGTGPSHSPTVSADGRFVAFVSEATDLVAGQSDTGAATTDVFLFDRVAGTTTLASHASASPTATGDQPSSAPALSADGRFVAFASGATNLVAGQNDANGADDVFLFDRAAGSTVLVSRTSASPLTTGNGSSGLPRVSGTGERIAFVSSATNLVLGQSDANASPDVFLFDRGLGSTLLVSRSAGSTATTGNGSSPPPAFPSLALNDDGHLVAFASTSTHLVEGQVDGNGAADVFLFDLSSSTTVLVSRAGGTTATAGDGESGELAMSPDGQFVAFTSAATNLVPGLFDENLATDVFSYSRLSADVLLVSRTPDDDSANAASSQPAVAANGNIAYASFATDLVPGQVDAPGARDVFLFHRNTLTGALASRTPTSATTTGNGDSAAPAISAGGTAVAFASAAADLVAGDGNGFADVFVYAFGGGSAGSFFTLPPCRLFDSRRPGQGPAFASGVPRVLTAHRLCGIPPSATSVALNVTVTEPTGAGHLAVLPGHLPEPVGSSTINFSAGQTRANKAVGRLSDNGNGTLAVQAMVAGNGTVHVLLDVTGYFE